MAGTRAGSVEITVLFKHICRLIAKYDSKLRTLIAAGVVAGTISSAQAASLNAWLDASAGVCLVWRALTGY